MDKSVISKMATTGAAERSTLRQLAATAPIAPPGVAEGVDVPDLARLERAGAYRARYRRGETETVLSCERHLEHVAAGFELAGIVEAAA